MNNLLTISILIFLIACTDNAKKQETNKDDEIKFNLKDTIPLIQMEEDAFVYPAIFEGSFKKGTNVVQQGKRMEFFIKEMGDLKVSSGKIIASDPVVLHDPNPFIYEFPKGNYPVELAIIKIGNDERVGYSRIKFSNNKIVEWKFALRKGEKDLPIIGSTLIGYSVDSGTGIYLDLDGANYMNSPKFDDYFEDIFIDKMDENYRPTWSYLNYEFKGFNLISFSTGYGDGYYGSYIGVDKDGEISQLLTDFQIIFWWNQKK